MKLYHYTIADRLVKIMIDGYLKLTPQTPKMCAGAYLHLKKVGKPNEIMQIAERFGYDN